jgi:hypothetical protein
VLINDDTALATLDKTLAAILPTLGVADTIRKLQSEGAAQPLGRRSWFIAGVLVYTRVAWYARPLEDEDAPPFEVTSGHELVAYLTGYVRGRRFDSNLHAQEE